MKKNKTIVITGASSGIGRALAMACAEPGVTLLLTGRDTARLEEVEALCRGKGAETATAAVSVTDKASMESLLLGWDDRFEIDLVVANAGISGGEAKFDEIMAINLNGTFNTINPLLPRLRARKRGHIALMSSMAGFRGLPSALAYSTSKVAVRAYGDALRPLLKPEGVDVSIIFPGFVRTPLTDANDFSMPFLMEADKAAEIIKDGLEKKKSSIAFPWQMHLICQLLYLLPRCLSDWMLSRAPRKN